LVLEYPRSPSTSLSEPPLVTTIWLNEPLVPTWRLLATRHCEPVPETNARLELAPAFNPRTPLPELVSSAPLVRSNWLKEDPLPTITRAEAKWLLTPARTSHTAGFVPEAPTTKSAMLEMNAPRVTSVPPLNSKMPELVVNTRRSTSINPSLRTLVP